MKTCLHVASEIALTQRDYGQNQNCRRSDVLVSLEDVVFGPFPHPLSEENQISKGIADHHAEIDTIHAGGRRRCSNSGYSRLGGLYGPRLFPGFGLGGCSRDWAMADSP